MASRHSSVFPAFLRIFLLWALVAFALSASNTLKSMEMGYNRLVLHFSKPFSKEQVHDFVLQGRGSVRYVFDLRGVRLGRRNLASGLKYGSTLRSVRVAQYRRHTARIVVETPEPYTAAHYPLSDTDYAIVLPKGSSDLGSSIKGLFASLHPQKSSSKSSSRSSKKRASADKRSRSSARSRPRASLMKKAPPHPHRHYRIIVDPGHGGHDTGALDPTHRYVEKRAVLAIALRLRKHLKAMGFDVVMTRSSDRFIKLHRRTRYANLKHGDVFVSIHANAVGRMSRANVAHGVETYFLSPARSARARRVAATENSIEFTKSYRDSMNSFIKTLTRSKIILSNKLALDVQSHILSELRSRYRGVVDGGVRPAPFWVLVGAEMPAILVETGYITHPWEKKRLYDPRYQDLEAKGIAEGIARFLANREKELE